MTDRELMQMALNTLDNYAFVELTDEKHWQDFKRVMEALRVRLAQPEPEPVAWMHIQGNHEEPNWRKLNEDEISRGWMQKPLYTAPPQREWVGLTDEEIKEIIGPWGGEPIKGYTRELIDKIESKLREKNT